MNHILECVDFFTTTNRAAVVGESLTAADYFMCVNLNHLLCMSEATVVVDLKCCMLNSFTKRGN